MSEYKKRGKGEGGVQGEGGGGGGGYQDVQLELLQHHIKFHPGHADKCVRK